MDRQVADLKNSAFGQFPKKHYQTSWVSLFVEN